MMTSALPPSSTSFPILEYRTLSAAKWTDQQLAEHVINTVAQPRQTSSDSFLLHSPLEVLARHRLLSYVDADRLLPARVRLLGVATQTAEYGPSVADPSLVSLKPDPRSSASPETIKAATTTLVAAIESGDLDAVDGLTFGLGQQLDPGSAASALIDFIAPFTSAAGHAPIFLHLALQSDLGALSLSMLRPLLTTLAQFPDWRIAWVDAAAQDKTGSTDVFDALASTPQLGQPGSDFIYPIMCQVDPDLAASLICSADLSSIQAVSRSIMRAAALSMLSEPTSRAPYGWTHCLTMPQAICRLTEHSADPARLLAIAATHVVGFRAAFASLPLPKRFEPEVPAVGWRTALDQDPDTAAAAVWHTSDSVDALITEFASRAAAHPDTHLVKYTLACIDETSHDPASGRLYLAAAAKLLSWWSLHDHD